MFCAVSITCNKRKKDSYNYIVFNRIECDGEQIAEKFVLNYAHLGN